MDKLIELLNECTNSRFKSEQDLRLCIEMRGYCRDFIKWLVWNNRIDIDKLHNDRDKIEIMENYVNANDYNTDLLLMLLSISSEPIEDLISYLK